MTPTREGALTWSTGSQRWIVRLLRGAGLPRSWTRTVHNGWDPAFWPQSLTFCPVEVRDCSLEEEIGCEESTGEDGGVSTSNIWGETQSSRRPLKSHFFSSQTVLACICKTELCNENWVAAGSSTTNQGGANFVHVLCLYLMEVFDIYAPTVRWWHWNTLDCNMCHLSLHM